MRVRSLKWKGLPIWPPEWSISSAGAGEEGILEEIKLHKSLTGEFIFVKATHNGENRKGVILLEDPDNLDILFHKLKMNIGKPLVELGDLQVDF